MYSMGQPVFKKLNKRIPALDIILFFRQLAALITAGIPIVQSCDILCKSQKNTSLQRVMALIKINMEAGHALSWCLAQFPRYFEPLICHLIEAGEQSGTLPAMLDRIALHKENVLSLKNKVKQALFYPTIVLLVALGVSITMLTVVIPRFAELFQSMHSSLPLFTLGVMHLSELIHNYYWLTLFPLLAILPLTYYAHYSASFRCRIERLVLQTPYFGPIYAKTILARFCRTLATTFAAGIPISESLKTIAYANGSYFYAQTILQLRAQIIKGQQLYQAMHRQLFFPVMLIQMVKIGEESGTLERMLEKIASIYEADVSYFIANCGHLLEPLLIAILGVLIGGLVIAMYLPIFKLGTVL